MIDIKSSFTAAEVVPIKLFLNDGVRDLKPIHLNWMPTNRCNLDCGFCSCASRNKYQEMPIKESLRVIRIFRKLGCQSVTITGGGEPLCHPHLFEMVHEFCDLGIEVGLVTNGLLLDQISLENLSLLTWCRISHADYRSLNPRYQRTLNRVTQVPIDWAFSYVVSPKPNLQEIEAIIDYANEKNFTHVRLVADLLCVDVVSFDDIRKTLKGKDQIVIYQARQTYTRGSKCLIGYIKPNVTPDFKMYLCCGVQYALENNEAFPEELCMGDARNLEKVYGNKAPFDTKCVRCYYEYYNTILRAMTSQIKHAKFI